MTWSAVLDWLSANALGVATFAVVAFGAFVSWLHFRRSKRDVTPRVFLLGERGNRREKVTVEHRGDSASPFTVELEVVNVGGSKLKRGKLTLTLSHGLQAVESPGWEEDTPNALVRDASAVSHRLPTIGRNDRYRPPPLTLHEPELRRPAGSHRKGYKLRWEVWKGREGLGSDDLKISYRLEAPPK